MTPTFVAAFALLGRAEGDCATQKPRRCGPLLAPGGHALGVEQRVSDNMLFINVSSRRALVCVPAKSGSTSFYSWLYRVLAGRPWPHRGEPWVHNTTSARWDGLRGRAVRLRHLTPRRRRSLLVDSAVRRFALHRQPLERAASAYLSKAACGHGDARDHVGIVRQLLRYAPRAAARLGEGSAPQADVPCLSPIDWARLLAEASFAGAEQRRATVNAHFLPQADACALGELGYHTLIPIADHAPGLAALARHLDLAPQPLGQSHRSTAGRGAAARAPSGVARLGNATLQLLRRVYAQDAKLLQYPRAVYTADDDAHPPPDGADGAAPRAAAAPASGKRGGMGAKQGGKGKGKGGKGEGKGKGKGKGQAPVRVHAAASA